MLERWCSVREHRSVLQLSPKFNANPRNAKGSGGAHAGFKGGGALIYRSTLVNTRDLNRTVCVTPPLPNPKS